MSRRQQGAPIGPYAWAGFALPRCPDQAVPGRATVGSTKPRKMPLGGAEHSAIGCQFGTEETE